jgi:hypothetical protein
MIYPYAIEPDALVTWDKCRHILDLMGFQHGRAIAAYPTRKRWKALVRAACRENTDLGDRDRRRILRKLDLSNPKMIRLGGPDDCDGAVTPAEQGWIRNAVARQAVAREFHAILSTRNPEGHPDVVLEEDVDESHQKLAVPREVPVLREPAALAAHVGTLVRNSRQLMLIDPHFDPSVSRWRPVVRACLALVAQAVHGTLRAEIHTLARRATPSVQDWPSSEEFERRCRSHVPGMLKVGVGPVRICRWRIRDDAPGDFHARYLLTDRGGYRLDKGLDLEPGKVQPVGLLDDQEWKRIREGFGDDSPFFDKDGEFTVTADKATGRRRSGENRRNPPAGRP